jgi:hypothetical protein
MIGYTPAEQAIRAGGMSTCYVYRSFEPGLWTVGFYDGSGKWYPESDQDSPEKAAERVAWLNGGPRPAEVTA